MLFQELLLFCFVTSCVGTRPSSSLSRERHEIRGNKIGESPQDWQMFDDQYKEHMGSRDSNFVSPLEDISLADNATLVNGAMTKRKGRKSKRRNRVKPEVSNWDRRAGKHAKHGRHSMREGKRREGSLKIIELADKDRRVSDNLNFTDEGQDRSKDVINGLGTKQLTSASHVSKRMDEESRDVKKQVEYLKKADDGLQSKNFSGGNKTILRNKASGAVKQQGETRKRDVEKKTTVPSNRMSEASDDADIVAETGEEIEAKLRNIETMQKTIKQTLDNTTTSLNEIQKLKSELEQKVKSVDQKQKEMDGTREELKAAVSKIADVGKDLFETQSKLSDSRDAALTGVASVASEESELSEALGKTAEQLAKEAEENVVEKQALEVDKSVVAEKAQIVDEEAESQMNRTKAIGDILSQTKQLLEEKKVDNLVEAAEEEERLKSEKKKIASQRVEIQNQETVNSEIKMALQRIENKASLNSRGAERKLIAAKEKMESLTSEVNEAKEEQDDLEAVVKEKQIELEAKANALDKKVIDEIVNKTAEIIDMKVKVLTKDLEKKIAESAKTPDVAAPVLNTTIHSNGISNQEETLDIGSAFNYTLTSVENVELGGSGDTQLAINVKKGLSNTSIKSNLSSDGALQVILDPSVTNVSDTSHLNMLQSSTTTTTVYTSTNERALNPGELDEKYSTNFAAVTPMKHMVYVGKTGDFETGPSNGQIAESESTSTKKQQMVLLGENELKEGNNTKLSMKMGSKDDNAGSELNIAVASNGNQNKSMDVVIDAPDQMVVVENNFTKEKNDSAEGKTIINESVHIVNKPVSILTREDKLLAGKDGYHNELGDMAALKQDKSTDVDAPLMQESGTGRQRRTVFAAPATMVFIALLVCVVCVLIIVGAVFVARRRYAKRAQNQNKERPDSFTAFADFHSVSSMPRGSNSRDSERSRRKDPLSRRIAAGPNNRVGNFSAGYVDDMSRMPEASDQEIGARQTQSLNTP